jgi:membrane glycosyltransferase
LVKLVRLMEQHPRAGIIQMPPDCASGTLYAAAAIASASAGRLLRSVW